MAEAGSIMYGQYRVPPAEELVNFKVGQPAPSMLPLDKIRKAATQKLSETDPLYLQYGDIPGYLVFRQSLAGFLTEGYGMDVSPEEVFATNGVTGGLSLLCSLFVTRGDTVFAEEPTYFLARSIFRDFGLNVVQVPMENDGLDMDKLEEALQKHGAPKFLYTIPTAHNPTGRTLSSAKREKLVALSEKYGFMIIADEVYQLLTFPQVTPPKPMVHFDKTGTVISLGSFSKILAPAMRLGWMHCRNKATFKKIKDCGQLDSSGGLNPVISGFVQAAIDMGLQQEHLKWTKQTLWNRASTLMEALSK
jgi:DNA-binding transcriptional MocR family regulator